MEARTDSTFSRQRKSTEKADLSTVLRKAWQHLRLSVRNPSRVPTWDAIVLTAASPEQAELYNWQLDRARRLGRISISTVTLAVPDPHGQRIGSGAATLNAIYALARHYAKLGVDPGTSRDIYDHSVKNESNMDSGSSIIRKSFENNVMSLAMVKYMTKRHILLLHAGGDSKRVPWANPMGKVFLPLSYLASDDPDGPVPLLFDHILAISSCARQAFKNEGGLFIMTGDVLPCFDASIMVLPEDASCIITVPITLDIASKHGVVVASESVLSDEPGSISLVDNLLQKPSMGELSKSQAILNDGQTLLDTGMIAVRGRAWFELVLLSSSSHTMILELLRSKKEMSLYEELVSAWVPAKHEWLRLRPLGEALISGLGRGNLFSYCAFDLVFLHFGTSCEILDHLNGINSELVGRRHLCSIPATTISDVASSAIILSSKITPGVSIGEDSLIYNSSISDGIHIGSQSIVVGINFHGDYHSPSIGGKYVRKFMLPNYHCIWEVPLVGSTQHVIVYCGLHDNPKVSNFRLGTFCGKPWEKVLFDLGIQEKELWDPSVESKCLWNSRIFPVLTFPQMLDLGTWLMGLNNDRSLLPLWRNAQRTSLEELHRSIDFHEICVASSNHQADCASGIARACINYGLLGRNLFQLCEEILQNEVSGFDICKEFLDNCSSLHAQNSMILPRSRAFQVQVDLLRACRDEASACELQPNVWSSVCDETASAVRYGYKDCIFELGNSAKDYEDETFVYRSAKVELPVRVDFVGGWSDTPPWSLEQVGCVLNMAINLNSSLPIGTHIETTTSLGLSITDDAQNHLFIDFPSSIKTPFETEDPFRLVKSALLVTNIIQTGLLRSVGLRIRTWANVPRGSGLGTSSILAAAVVKGLLQIGGGDDGNESVARLVLVLEQMMGTGGGWQDQIGGLYPGIKFTMSFPGIPLRLQVVPLSPSPKLIVELEQQLLVVFTGQVRVANEVLQKVVTRYLRRDNQVMSSIKRLASLAKKGKEAVMKGDVEEMGEIMLECWDLHQELDPWCSNECVDRLFAMASEFCCGYKLVGAGGGGFAILLANDARSAQQLRRLLVSKGDSEFPVRVYDWKIVF